MPEKESDLIHVLNSQTFENCLAGIDHDSNVKKTDLKSFCQSESENINERVLSLV